MVRTLNILGLFLTTVGAVLLLRYPPIATTWTFDGASKPSWKWTRTSMAATVIFAVGFVLTLTAIIGTAG